METEHLRVDGNAAGGLLAEVFALEMTAALAMCAGCGTTQPLGALPVYGGMMGTIVRCPGCDTAMLRIARGPTLIRVDLRGVRILTIAVAAFSAESGLP